MRQRKPKQPDGIFLFNIGQLVTLRSSHDLPRRGSQLAELSIIKDGAILCLGGKIVAVGTTRRAVRDQWIKENRKALLEVDCSNKIVIPGFVDSHTHPAFVSPRLTDFEQRISGSTYEEIAGLGGGIRSSVKAVRKARKEDLAARVLSALDELSSYGTTTVEAKSGYGLSPEAELKSLEAICAASSRWPGTAIPTLLGAHVVAPEFRSHPSDYVSLVCNKMIPQAAKRKLARFVDVFCDRGAFREDDALKIASSARANGLSVRVHISQLTRTPIERLLSLEPASLDHLDCVNDRDIALLSRSRTISTLVPGANYFLGLAEYPPARKLIDAGVAVALATDYNPGSSPIVSMPLVLSIACTQMKMSPAETLAASTINGAWSLRLADRKGSLEPGKDADVALFDVNDYREIPYWVGSNKCALTILNGHVQQNRQTN